MTAHHWRILRLKLVLAGIHVPMALPSMHYLFDAMESLILESMVSNKPEKDKADREHFWDQLYRPSPADLDEIKADAIDSGWKPPPAGFDPEAVDDGFDTALSSLTGRAR